MINLPFRKGRKPMAHRVLHPLMQATPDPNLPITVATDHAFWGTFSTVFSASDAANTIADHEPIGERIAITTTNGRVLAVVKGRNPFRFKATTRE